MCDIIFLISSLLEKFPYYVLNGWILFLLVSKDISWTGGGRARRSCYCHPFLFGSDWDFVLLYRISFAILYKSGSWAGCFSRHFGLGNSLIASKSQFALVHWDFPAVSNGRKYLWWKNTVLKDTSSEVCPQVCSWSLNRLQQDPGCPPSQSVFCRFIL